MARQKGTKDPSTRRTRNAVEREEEILFLVNLFRENGADFSATDAGRILNLRRATVARETVLALGGTVEEAEAAAAASQLSVQAIRGDVRLALDRMRSTANIGSALWLDEQIAECRAAIERLDVLNDMAIEDLRRSRTVNWTRTRGQKKTRPRKDGRKGADGHVEEETFIEPSEIMTFRREDGPAIAALYAVIRQNLDQQSKLREEIRKLQFGRMWFPEKKAGSTFTEALLQLDDPNKARDAALQLYAREIESLYRAEEMGIAPGDPEGVRRERLRLTVQAQRVRQLGAFIEHASPEEAGRGGLEVVVTRRTPRALTAGEGS